MNEIIAEISRLKAEGLAAQKIADAINEKGFRGTRGKKITRSAVYYYLNKKTGEKSKNKNQDPKYERLPAPIDSQVLPEGYVGIIVGSVRIVCRPAQVSETLKGMKL